MVEEFVVCKLCGAELPSWARKGWDYVELWDPVEVEIFDSIYPSSPFLCSRCLDGMPTTFVQCSSCDAYGWEDQFFPTGEEDLEYVCPTCQQGREEDD